MDARLIGGFELRHFDRLEDGAVLFTTPAEADYKIDIGVGISFREGGVVSGRPMIAALYDFASLANSIIKLFDVP